MTTSKIEVIAPANEPVIITHRFIKASPALLFKCWTTPEIMKQWLGPKELVMTLCEVDLRVGGAYRYVHRARTARSTVFTESTWRSKPRTAWSAHSSSSRTPTTRQWTP